MVNLYRILTRWIAPASLGALPARPSSGPFDMNVIKVSGKVKKLLIENVIAWNPARRNMNGEYYQEVIDIFGSNGIAGEEPPVSDVIVRGCWLFQLIVSTT